MVLVKGPVYLTVLNIIYGLVQLHPLPDISAALTTVHTILAPTKFLWHFSLLSSERLKCVGFLCQLFFFNLFHVEKSWSRIKNVGSYLVSLSHVSHRLLETQEIIRFRPSTAPDERSEPFHDIPTTYPSLNPFLPGSC